MSIPGSSLSGLGIDPDSLSDDIYPSSCTFLRPVITRDAAGQELHLFEPIDSAHTGLRCRKSPGILIRPQQQEAVRGDFQQKDARWQISISTYVADANVTWLAVVDGVSHVIVSVENDGNKLTTRLGVSDAVPFNS